MPTGWANTLTAKVINPDGDEVTIDWLKYASIDGEVFGKSSRRAFLVAGGVPSVPLPSWVDLLLTAQHGTVTTKRRQTLEVTFREADEQEHSDAMENITELRHGATARSKSEELRVIVMEIQ